LILRRAANHRAAPGRKSETRREPARWAIWPA
jgi:hypothetical protein